MTPSGHSSRTPSGVKPAGQTSDSGSASSAVRSAPGVGRVSYTSMGQAPPGGAAFPPVIELAPRVPSSLQYVVAASLGVLAAASLGAGGFWVWKSLQPAPASQSVVVVTPVETEPAILPPTPPSTGTVVPPAALPPITFKVLPDKAVLVVEGTALPLAVRSIPRPASGTSKKVTVHADGYEDQTLTIDETAPASVDVWLNESTPKRSGGHGSGEGAAKAPEALPANPY